MCGGTKRLPYASSCGIVSLALPPGFMVSKPSFKPSCSLLTWTSSGSDPPITKGVPSKSAPSNLTFTVFSRVGDSPDPFSSVCITRPLEVFLAFFSAAAASIASLPAFSSLSPIASHLVSSAVIPICRSACTIPILPFERTCFFKPTSIASSSSSLNTLNPDNPCDAPNIWPSACNAPASIGLATSSKLMSKASPPRTRSNLSKVCLRDRNSDLAVRVAVGLNATNKLASSFLSNTLSDFRGRLPCPMEARHTINVNIS
mmetsp:Transcript_105968/g.167276  ORF Transcript_105968/g.167276 Transcript_105968/m.167276 type:complete len:259 (-) Transcript_105968:46-822(-)